MASINDYLTKQLLIEKNVVTFRSLSRQFNLHVNAAKNELAAFHEASQVPSESRPYATYVLTGEVSSDTTNLARREDEMDVDSETQKEEEYEEDDGEEVPRTQVLLVGERDLESAKSRFARLYSAHIYCLSPSPLTDAGLVCAPSEQVYKADEKLSGESAALLGRVIGPHIHMGKPIPATAVASSSKTKEPGLRKPGLAPKEKEKEKDKQKEQEEDKPSSKEKFTLRPGAKEKEPAPAKAKATGKLDWSKAKPKEKGKEKEKEKDKDKAESKKAEAKPEKAKPAAPKPKEQKKAEQSKSKSDDDSPGPESKRGTKRKMASAMAISDSEDDCPTPVVTKSKARAKKTVLISDEEDDEEDAPRANQAKGKGKAKVVPEKKMTEADKSLRAMMDIDDSEVIKASRPAKNASEPEEEDPKDVEMEDDTEVATKPKPRKKKEKKVIPIGKNGLKKKRVVKSRMKVDDKGYMVTEDYSSYESVDEEDALGSESDAPKAKGKKTAAKGKKGTDKSDPREEKPAKRNGSMKEPSRKPTKASNGAELKRTSSSGNLKQAGQGSLMNFFGKK